MPAFSGNALNFLNKGPMVIAIAQIEAVNESVGNIQCADSLGRLGFLFFVCILIDRFQEVFAIMPLDAVAVEQPIGSTRVKPAQNRDVARDRFQEEPARVIGAKS